MKSRNANNKRFSPIPLRLYPPKWNSKLASVVIELEKLRVKQLPDAVPKAVFFQLKNIFQNLESLGSARIEGNNTTLSEFVEKIIKDPLQKNKDETLREIHNIERAIEFIENTIHSDTQFDRALISEIHKILVNGIVKEGSKYPGQLRPVNVSIARSNHVPPGTIKVPDYFNELMEFVNQPLEAQNHLLMIALSHHRMAWIHPFDNGNGRLVRMFTYALLIKQGFQIKTGRILNPTAVFCMNRDKYYEMLALADSGEETKVLKWCSYVLEGLKVEIEKIDNLLDRNYITNVILLPVLSYALENQYILKREYDILSALVKSKEMQLRSSDLNKIIGGESSVQRSRILKKLRDKKILVPLKENGKIYTIGFINNYLMRAVVHVLEKNSFIPEFLNKNAEVKKYER